MFIVAGCLILILIGVAFFSKIAAITIASVLLLLLFLGLIYNRHIREKYMADDNLQDQRYKVLAYEKNPIGKAWINSNPKSWYDFLRARKLTRDFTVIDLITTGTNPVFDEIIEISAIRFVNAQETDRYFTRIKPTFHIPTEVTENTKIEDDTVKSAPLAENIWPDFLAFIDQHGKLENLIGHHALLYIRFIIATSKRLGVDMSRLRVFDTENLTKAYMDVEKATLSAVKAQMGVNTPDADTMSNCKAVAALYLTAYDTSLTVK